MVIKCRPSFTKSPSLVYIDPKVSKIQPFENVKIYKEMYGHRHAVRHSVRMPYISLFVNFLTIDSHLVLHSLKLGNDLSHHMESAGHNIEATILDKINGTSGPPLPPFQWCQNGAFLAPSRLHHCFGGGGWGIIVPFYTSLSIRLFLLAG